MKNNKFCSDIDSIDICSQIVSTLHSNGIEHIWQLISHSDDHLIVVSGNKFNARLISSGLVTFLKGASSENLIKVIDSFLEKPISDFPEIFSLVDVHLRNKKLVYLFGSKPSEAKKILTGLINQEIAKLN